MTEPNPEDEPGLALLQAALSAAVPLHIAELKGKSWAEIMALAQECAQVVAEKGDVILYRSKKKGETAKAFNALARGIACLAFAPGGVHTFGLSFEAQLAGDWGLRDVAPEHVEVLTKPRLRRPRRVEE